MSDPEQVAIELQGNVHHAVPLEDDDDGLHKQGTSAPLSDHPEHAESVRHHEHEKHPEDEGGRIVKYGIVQKGWSFDAWTWKKMFIDMLPNDDYKVLHEKNIRLFWTLAIIAHAFSMGLFTYFFYTGIVAGLSQKFISLDKTSGNCEEIGAVMTLKTYGSRFGTWEGFDGFKFNDAKYLFTFQGFDGILFNDYITNIFASIDKIGMAAKSEPYHVNLIRWVTYSDTQITVKDGKQSVAKFEFAGEATSIFDRLYAWNLFYMSGGSDDGTGMYKCEGDMVRYDKNKKMLEVMFEDMDGNAPPTGDYDNSCATIFSDASIYGFDSDYGDTFYISLDVESLMLAASLNLGIMNGTHLDSEGGALILEQSTYSTLSEDRVLAGYTNPDKKGMRPIYCNYNVHTNKVFVTEDTPYCYLRVGDKPCIPAFTSYNEDCMSCDSDYNGDGTVDPLDCIVMDTVASCLLSEDMNQMFTLPHTMTATDLYDKMNAMHASGSHKVDLSWCDTSSVKCILLNVNMYDNENNKINEYNLQLSNITTLIDDGTQMTLEDTSTVLHTVGPTGFFYDLASDRGTIDKAHCANSYSTTAPNWHKFIESPPSPLYLNYFECTSNLWNIILEASGVAGANSALFGGTILMIFMIGITFFIDNVCPGIELPDDELKVKIMYRLNHYPG